MALGRSRKAERSPVEYARSSDPRMQMTYAKENKREAEPILIDLNRALICMVLRWTLDKPKK